MRNVCYNFNNKILSPMNRICLKRKQLQRKNSLYNSNQNKEPTEQKQTDTLVQKLQQISNPSLTNIPKAVQSILVQKSDQIPIVSSKQTASFEDFRKQYDELRYKYDEQRKQCDQLNRLKKIQEIQLLNSNTQYYEKQMKRLKVEVEKYQEENEDHKYKYIMAENGKKQFEATAKMKTEDLKKTLQQFEKQKILATEYKHQIGEKQKCFQRITEELEKSNKVLSNNFEELTAKCQKLEATLKSKSSDLENNIKNNEFLNKKLAELEKVMKNNKEIFDQTNFKKAQIIQELENRLRNISRTSRNTIEDLEFKIQEIKNQRKTENLLVDQRIETMSSLKTQRQNQLEIVRLQQTSKQLKADYQDKCNLIKKLEDRLLSSYTQEQYKELQAKIQEKEVALKKISQSYQQKIFILQKEISTLKLSQLPDIASHLSGNNNQFKQVLKSHLQENAKLRSELSNKVEELFNVKSNLEDMKCKVRTLQDEIVICQKKIKSLEKNHRIQADVLEQNMKNQLDSLKRKLQMMTAKLENKTKEVKQKQNFIINTIVGRSRQQDVPLILADFQRVFEIDYYSKLLTANARIQELEKQITVK